MDNINRARIEKRSRLSRTRVGLLVEVAMGLKGIAVVVVSTVLGTVATAVFVVADFLGHLGSREGGKSAMDFLTFP